MPGVTTAYQAGVHGSRPAATAGCILYSCSTHGLVYRSDGAAWSTWLTLPSGASAATPALTFGTAAAAGSAGTFVATDATLPIFDATVPSTQAFSDAAAAGAAAVAARRDHKHGMPASPGGGGSDLVQTFSGSGSVYVPGLRGSPNAKPASPSASDDEFEALSGWTTLGALDTSNVSDFASHWHAKRTNAGVGIDGLYKTAPSMPFTVTAKIAASNVPQESAGTQAGSNYNHVAILLTESSPGKCCTYGFVVNAAVLYTSIYRWTNRAALASNVDTSTGASATYGLQWPYIRLVVASSTDISGFISRDGFLWYPTASQQNVTSGLTVANVGLAIGDAAGGGVVEAVFDWIRFS